MQLALMSLILQNVQGNLVPLMGFPFYGTCGTISS